jgi:hypothetical protein
MSKAKTATTQIDLTIKTISGRDLVSSSEMVDLLLDIRSILNPMKETLKDICEPVSV